MTKRQRKEIAIMWCATFMNIVENTDWSENLDPEDAEGIQQECIALSERILGKRPFILTLPRIIDHVLADK